MDIKVINSDYTLTATDYTVIATDLTNDITITLPAAADNKGRMLIINQFNTVKADGTPVKVNFNYPVLYSSNAQYPYIAVSLFGGVTAGSAKITLQSDGINWYVITYTM
ncbi:hypothetical protein IR010_19970 [Flavobacterium sp. MR2016-29]|nr:hypothetical protein [Flavobacterium sp. MR2016-29]